MQVTLLSAVSSMQISDEFVVLGSQPLTGVVDRLHCVAAANLASLNKQGSGGSFLFMEVRHCRLTHV